MTNTALLVAQEQMTRGDWRLFAQLLGFAAIIVFIALVIITLNRAADYFGSAGKEQKLLRMELGKLAEEVSQLRRQLDSAKEQDDSAKQQ